MATSCSHKALRRWIFVSSVLLVVGIFLIVYGIAYAAAVPVWLQCRDGSPPTGTCTWTGGNLNASQTTYVEGMATPQQAMWDGLTSSNHSVGWSMQWTKAGHHAYDFAVSWG